MPGSALHRRASAVAVAALLALAVLLVSPPCAAPAGAADPPPSPRLGVAAGGALAWLSDADLARELDLVRSTGAAWVRLDVDWSHVERDRGRFDWASTDRVVAAARARGLSVLGLVTYAPRWAQASPGAGEHPAPRDPAAFASFAGRAALRYAGRVAAWEVWNEPNSAAFWSPRPDPGAYAALLRAAAPAIRAADPVALVLSGGLAPAVDDGTEVSPVTFVQRLYATGAAASADALAVHPYSYPAMPDDARTASWNTFWRLRLVHDVMAAHGDGAKQVWLTEFGAPTTTAPQGVSASRQAGILRAGLARAAATAWIGPLFVYQARDTGTDASDLEQNFGLVRHDWTPKPALAVVRAAARADAVCRARGRSRSSATAS